ncbi:hypothetical protein ACKAV7_005395 [Fusarium commune]
MPRPVLPSLVSRSLGSRDPDLVHQACEPCAYSKKKCDKAVPSCSRCIKLGIKCASAVYTVPATIVANPGHWLHSDPYEATGFNIIDPSFSISNSSIASLLACESSAWSRTMNSYFETVNSCLTIIHPKLFAARTQNLDLDLGVVPDNPATILLMVCMQIVTQTDHDRLFECCKTIQSDGYKAAKRILGILRGLSPPCIELIQCTILLALVKLKHGDNMRAYISIGDAYTLALALGIRPGQYIEAERWLPVSYNEEERRCVYWSLLILDRLIHIDSNLTHIPLQVAAPADDDLLPTINIVWDHKNQTQTRTIQRNPANEAPSVPLGAFQRKCQWARLYTEVLCPQPKSDGAEGLQNSLMQLHVFTQALLEAMVLQANHWGGFHEAIACSSCLLLLICSRQLQTLNSAATNVELSGMPVSKIISALNFAIRIIRQYNEFQRSAQPSTLPPFRLLSSYPLFNSMLPYDFERLQPFNP